MNTVQTRFWTLPFLAVLGIVVAGAMIWRNLQPYPIADTYPVYFGAQAWLKTGNAYNLDAVVDPIELRSFVDANGVRTTPYEQMHRYGNAYPFPLSAWLLPLSLLSPKVFAVVWIGLLTAVVVLALRWIRAPLWLLAFYPLWQGIRLEQIAIVVFVAQIVGVYALLERSDARSTPWLVAFASAIAMLKPTQGAVVALAMIVMGQMWRHWKIMLVAFGVVWGLPTLLDPNWIAEWLASSRQYRAVSLQYIPWLLAVFMIAFAWWRDWVSAAAWLQFAVTPFTWVYTAVSLPLRLLKHRLMAVIVVLSNAWILIAALLVEQVGKARAEIAAIVLTIGLPMLLIGMKQRCGRSD